MVVVVDPLLFPLVVVVVELCFHLVLALAAAFPHRYLILP
jgi:hypothetical protein